jgi:hypothetical protein
MVFVSEEPVDEVMAIVRRFQNVKPQSRRSVDSRKKNILLYGQIRLCRRFQVVVMGENTEQKRPFLVNETPKTTHAHAPDPSRLCVARE